MRYILLSSHVINRLLIQYLSTFSTVSYIDDLIGDVLTRLSDNGFADNTIVFLMSDHGWTLGMYILDCTIA